MIIKIKATRTTVNKKYEEWNNEKKEYTEYDNDSIREEVIKLEYKDKHVKVIGVRSYYSLDRIHLDVNFFPLTRFLCVYRKNLKSCNNVSDCINMFKKAIEEEMLN